MRTFKRSVFIIIISSLLLSLTCINAQTLSKNITFGILSDDSKDFITYTIVKTENGYDGSLNIFSSKNDTLWAHSWTMAENDMKDILMQADVSIEFWVENFFNSDVDYTSKIVRQKLTSEDLQQNYIDFYAEKYSLDGSFLSEMILSDSSSVVLIYRATWREDLLLNVFVPKLGKFVGFSGGEY